MLAIFHNFFQILLLSLSVPFFICSIFGDEKILKNLVVLTIPVFLISTVTYWLDEDSGSLVYKITTMTCDVAFITASFVFSLAIVKSQADQLAYISKSYQKQTELIEELKIEPLTKLYNRTAMDNAVNRVIRNVGKAANPPSVAIMDLDLFKSVNDKYGHVAGDEVLIALADLIRINVNFRKAFRYGGEEFLLVFDDMPIESAITVVEKIRHQFASMNFDFAPGKAFTISAGIAEYSEDQDEKQWIEAADKALYKSKENGRDQLTVAD